MPGWEVTAVRPGGGRLLLSWLSLGVTSGPGDVLLLERLQSRVPSRDPQAPRRFCVLVVSREQEALAGQNGIPESQIPSPGSRVSEVHKEAARPPGHTFIFTT